MTDNNQARIRQRAYEIWMDEGRLGDRAEANWLQAEAELAREAMDRHDERQQGEKSEKSQPQRDSDRDQRASTSKQRDE